MRRLAMVSTICVIAANCAAAQPMSKEREAFIDLSEKAITCAAYNTTIATCVGAADPNISAISNKQADFMLNFAITAAEAANLKPEAFKIRSQFAVSEIAKEIDGDCANKIIIIQKYGSNCNSLYRAIMDSKS